MELSVYFDDKYTQLSTEKVSFLAPLVAGSTEHIWGEDRQQIHEREIIGKKVLTRADSFEQADIIVFPVYFQLEYLDILKSIAQQAKGYNKRVMVFYTSDVEDYIDAGDTILWFKRSLNKRGPYNEISLPAFPHDIGAYQQEVLQPTTPPSVGYVGYSNYYDTLSFVKYRILQLGYCIFYPKSLRKVLLSFKNEKLYHLLTTLGRGKYVRGKVINALKMSKYIQFNYRERKVGMYMDAPDKLRQEYIDNLQDSLFALIMRGNGNYSFRFYEVFSMGKIPIIIDTNIKLPFEDEIQYDRIAIIIPFDDISNIEKYIIDFYETNKTILPIIQEEIRRVYEEYFVINSCYEKLILKAIGHQRQKSR